MMTPQMMKHGEHFKESVVGLEAHANQPWSALTRNVVKVARVLARLLREIMQGNILYPHLTITHFLTSNGLSWWK